MKHLFLATISGALVAFLWGYISWEVLTWHELDGFTDGDEVAEVIVKNADVHSVYAYPRAGEFGPDSEAITKGPFVYAVVRPDPLAAPWSMSLSLVRSFLIQLAGAFIIALTTFRIRANRYISRASVGCMMGLFAGVVMVLPSWNWFELPMRHALAQALDPFIAWTMAGLVMAAIIKPKKPRRVFSK